MKLHKGFHVPDRETRLEELFGNTEAWPQATYQRHKVLAAMEACKYHRTALDVGGHVGLWALQLREKFDRVISFEPDPEQIECFQENTRSTSGIELHPFGLSDSPQRVSLTHKPGTSLKTFVSRLADEPIQLMKLDSFVFATDQIDLIKIDTEGYEYFVVKGAERTIKLFNPTIIVEQKPGVASKRFGIEDQAALRLLESWGYRQIQELNGDFIMVHG